MAEADSRTVTSFRESSYTPIKEISAKLLEKREEFKSLVKASDSSNPGHRKAILKGARDLFLESKNTGFTIHEKHNIQESMNSVMIIDTQISNIVSGIRNTYRVDSSVTSTLQQYNNRFDQAIDLFIERIDAALQVHGQLYKTKEKFSQMELIVNALDLKKRRWRMNKFGIPISPEMDFMAELLARRVDNELDNFLPTEGPTGFGKTSFVWALGSTVAEKRKVDSFSPRDNFFFNEDTAYVEERFKNAQPGTVLIPDEFGNQANKRRFYEDGQIAFMDRLKLIRFHGLTILPCWPEVNELDSQLMSKIHGIFRIQEKDGPAQFRVFNKNPYARRKEFIPYKARDIVAHDSEEGNRIIEAYDELTLMSIPFTKIPDVLWQKDYLPLKEQANAIGHINRSKEQKKTEHDLLLEFLAKLPDPCIRIGYNDLKAFSREKSFLLHYDRLLNEICRATNHSRVKIFKPYLDSSGMPILKESKWEGYIDVDPIIEEYIKKVRAQFEGSKKAAKAGVV